MPGGAMPAGACNDIVHLCGLRSGAGAGCRHLRGFCFYSARQPERMTLPVSIP
ncbi:hypothetical protein KCP73_22105 [Salmonella enterica subsp. enterica]|nr:hypothetical protein KCP73_22105 [Salmonella enterica subsp. enterica]